MTHRTLVAAALALILVLTACGRQSPAPSEEIAGQWAGTWASTSGGGGNVQATFAQTDDQVSGTVSITNSPCLSTGTISGTISNSNVTFGAVSGPDGVQFAGTVAGNVIDGTYSVSSGFCEGDAGTFKVFRQ